MRAAEKLHFLKLYLCILFRMGREYDAMAAECGTAGANRTDTVNGTAVAEENAGAGSIYRLTAEAAAVLQNENTEWTVLCVDYKNGSYQNRLCLDAKENSRLNVLIVFRSGEDAQGTSSFQVRVGRMFTIISFCPIVSSCRYHSCTCMPRSKICYFKIPAANSNHLLSDTAFHLKLNQVIHLNHVLKRQLLRYIIRKSADDHCARVLLADAA